MRQLLWGAMLIAILTADVRAHAQPSADAGASTVPRSAIARWWRGEHALGDFGGLRSTLAERGVVLDSYYVHNIAGNPRGGRRRGFTYVDNIYVGLDVDLGRLLGLTGTHLTVSGIRRWGQSLTVDYVGSQYNSQQVFGGQTLFLYGVYLDQHLLEGALSLKIGRFGASDDFNTSGLYGYYMNNGIDGNVRNVLFDTQFSAYPFATWAARLRVAPTHAFNAQVGVYQTSDRVFDPARHGLDWSIRRGDGVFAIAQLSLTPDLYGDDAAPAHVVKSRRGHYWVGASISRWSYRRFDDDTPARLSYGGYAHADQLVYRERPESDEGLTLWAAAALYPQRDISIVPLQVNVGLVYKGLLPGRGEDRLILGAIYGVFSRTYADVRREAGEGEPRYELVTEVAYRLALRKFAYVQPDLQWIDQPGGTGRIADAWVVGMQTGVVF